MGRLYHEWITGKTFEVARRDHELFKERTALVGRWSERRSDMFRILDDARMQATLDYFSKGEEPQEHPMPMILAHAFNQATYHRSQLRAALSRRDQPSLVRAIPYVLTDSKIKH